MAENACNLSVDDAELVVIAIRTGGVRRRHGIVVATEGGGLVAHVAVGTSFDVMRQHPLVGCAMHIVVVHQQATDAVRCEVHVCLVLRIGAQEQVAHAQRFAHLFRLGIHAAQHTIGGIGQFVRHQTVRHSQPTFKVAMFRAGGENGGDEEYQKCPKWCHDMQRYDFFCNAVNFFDRRTF